MNYLKKYWYVIVGGIVLLWLLIRSRSNGGDTQVVNRVIPIDQTTDRPEFAKLEYEFELGKLQLATEADLAQKAIAAEGQRLDFQNRALEIQGNFGLKALEIERLKAENESALQRDLARIAGDTSLTDTQLRVNALSELQRQQANQNLLATLGNLGSNILQALRGQQQRSSGGIGGSAGTPPINPSTQQRNQALSRQAALARIGDWITRNFYSPVTASDAGFLGYANPLDLSGYYDREASAMNDWLQYDPFNYFDQFEPQGFVDSYFTPLTFPGSYGDFWSPLGFDNFNDWYNDYYGA